MREATLLDTRLKWVGATAFLVALAVQIGVPPLSSCHIAGNGAACAPVSPGGSLDVAAAASGAHDDDPQDAHDPLTCQICYLISAAQALRFSIPYLNFALDVPRGYLDAIPAASCPERRLRAAIHVRAPPPPRLFLV